MSEARRHHLVGAQVAQEGLVPLAGQRLHLGLHRGGVEAVVAELGEVPRAEEVVELLPVVRQAAATVQGAEVEGGGDGTAVTATRPRRTQPCQRGVPAHRAAPARHPLRQHRLDGNLEGLVSSRRTEHGTTAGETVWPGGKPPTGQTCYRRTEARFHKPDSRPKVRHLGVYAGARNPNRPVAPGLCSASWKRHGTCVPAPAQRGGEHGQEEHRDHRGQQGRRLHLAHSPARRGLRHPRRRRW